MSEGEDVFTGLDLNGATKIKIIDLLEDAATRMLVENIHEIVLGKGVVIEPPQHHPKRKNVNLVKLGN